MKFTTGAVQLPIAVYQVVSNSSCNDVCIVQEQVSLCRSHLFTKMYRSIFGKSSVYCRIDAEFMKKNEQSANRSCSPNVVCDEVSFVLLHFDARFGWFLRITPGFTYGVGFVQCKTAVDTRRGRLIGLPPSLGCGAKKSARTCSGLATVTRTSSFGLGREGTLRGPAGGLLALRTAWGGDDVFSS